MKLSKKSHKLVAILSILAILFTLGPASAFAAEPMEDISSHWAKDEIQSWVDSGYIKGYPDGTFKPDNFITRAEFMTIVNSAFGYTEKAEIDYSDVAEKSWYADAIAIAKAAGYISGYTDGTMKPNTPISRQEAAVIVAKINELEVDEAAAEDFTDGAEIPAWSKGSVGACVAAEIFTGYPDGSFLAENLIERGESVVALSKALAYKNAPVAVAATVAAISAEGFQLNLTPAVDGLTQSAVTLAKGDNNVTVEAITTTNGGLTYTVTADLEEGQAYKLNISKEGYNFGEELTFTVSANDQTVTDQQVADAVTVKISALTNPADITLDDLTAVNEAEAAFNALSDVQKALVSAENKTKLNDAVAKIDSLQTASNGSTNTEQEGNSSETGNTNPTDNTSDAGNTTGQEDTASEPDANTVPTDVA